MGDTDHFTDVDRIVRTDGPLSATLDSEAVLLEPDGGVYYGMNDVGTLVWEELDVEEPTSVADLRTSMLEAFDVEPSVVNRDLQEFLSELREAGLIEVRDSATLDAA